MCSHIKPYNSRTILSVAEGTVAPNYTKFKNNLESYLSNTKICMDIQINPIHSPNTCNKKDSPIVSNENTVHYHING